VFGGASSASPAAMRDGTSRELAQNATLAAIFGSFPDHDCCPSGCKLTIKT
jgi:hypothetical protein